MRSNSTASCHSSGNSSRKARQKASEWYGHPIHDDLGGSGNPFASSQRRQSRRVILFSIIGHLFLSHFTSDGFMRSTSSSDMPSHNSALTLEPYSSLTFRRIGAILYSYVHCRRRTPFEPSGFLTKNGMDASRPFPPATAAMASSRRLPALAR